MYNILMVRLVGPLFSLSASGTFAGTVKYWYGPYGPVCGSPKRAVGATTPLWEINKEWFKAASDRWKTFNAVVKKAWHLYAHGKGDCGRDLFMGKQIEMWNLSPVNDVTFPTAPYYSIPDAPGVHYEDLIWWPVGVAQIKENQWKFWLWDGYYSAGYTPGVSHAGFWGYGNVHSSQELRDAFSSTVAGVRWYRVLDNSNPPSEDDRLPDTDQWFITVFGITEHINYFWYRLIRINGDLTNLTYAYRLSL